MYKFVSVVKFNDQYFEDKDVVVITKNDDSVAVGAIIIEGRNGSVTDNNYIALDISEKYHQKRCFIYTNDIRSIQKVNEQS